MSNSPLKPFIQHTCALMHINIQEHYFRSVFTSLCTNTMSCDGTQQSACCHSVLSRVGIHAICCNVLQPVNTVLLLLLLLLLTTFKCARNVFDVRTVRHVFSFVLQPTKNFIYIYIYIHIYKYNNIIL